MKDFKFSPKSNIVKLLAIAIKLHH